MENSILKNWFFGSLAILAVMAHTGYAQSTIPQRDLWIIGQNVVKFNGVLPGNISGITTAPIHVQTYTDGTNPNLNSQTLNTAYHDENGDLLFYIMDSKVYDWEGRFIGSLVDNHSNDISGYKEIAIMPDKCNPRIFYIIAGDRANTQHQGGGNIQFTKLEIGLDINMISANGLANVATGDILADGRLGFANDNLIPTAIGQAFAMHPMLTINNTTQTLPSFNLSISKKQSDGERLLFINNTFEAAIFTSTEILTAGNNGPTIIPNPIYNTLSGGYIATSESELYQQSGSNIIRLADRNTINGYFYTDYTYSSGTILPNPPTVSLNDPIIPSLFSFFGLEFSENGRYLFFTASNQPGGLGYFDLNQTNPVAINLSANVNITNFANSQIELGKDGALYFCNGTQLGRLTNANNPTSINSTNFTTINLPNVVLPTGTSWHQDGINLAEFIFTLNDQVDGEPPYPIATGVGNTLAEAKCCIEHRVYTVDTYTVNGTNHNQTWSNGANNNPFNATGIVSIKNRLVIPAGYSVTINNMIFEYKPFQGDPLINSPSFVDGAKCILERSLTNAVNGGQLTLNNTDFRGTNTCYYGMWDGVEVQGDPNAPQQVIGGSPLIVRHQARLLVYNNSIIQDAYYGATNYEFSLTNGSSGGFFSFTSAMKIGGIIVAKNATFKNNYIGVAFAPYSVANVLSNFTTTNFLVTAPLKNPLITPFTMALVFQNKIMNFKTCNFKNQVPTTYPIVPTLPTSSFFQGIHGIFSYDASLRIFGTSTLGNPAPYNTGCVFENLAYGIRAFNFNTNTILLQSSIFTNNWRGSYFGSYSGASVTITQRNKYYVNETAPPAALDAAYGHYLDYCNNFIVQENRFYYNSFVEPNTLVGGQYNAYGCIVNEENPKQICEKRGYKGDEVYKNLFKEINIGAQAQGFNAELARNLKASLYDNTYHYDCHNNNSDHDQGLKYICNTFSGTDDNDITVMTDGATNSEGRIAFRQGGGFGAGNEFSHINTGGVNCTAFNGTNEREIYIDKTGIDDTKPNYLQYYYSNTPTQIPNCFSPLSIAPNPNSIYYNTGNLQPVQTNNNTCPSKITNIIKYPAYIVLHKKLAKEIIKLQQPLIDGAAPALYNTIANGTANQINTALNTKSPYLSDGVLIAAIRKGLPTHIIKHILISNSPLTAVVKLKADSLPLDANTKQQINTAQTGISPRQILEGQISDLKDEQHGYEIQALYGMQADTLNVTADSLVAFITYLGGHDVSIKRLKAYIAYRDTLMAKAEMMAINVAMGGSPLAAYLSKLTDMYVKYTYGAIAITKDPATMLVVEATRAVTTAYESKSAEGIHESKTKNPYREWIQGKSYASAQRLGKTAEEETQKVLANKDFKLYPNPTTGLIYFEYMFEDASHSDATIAVYNMMGAQVISGNLQGNTGNGSLDLTELPSGMYFVNVIHNNAQKFTAKINVVK